ncbi:MAG: hypothetical protein PHY05_09345 [Methanothrix sp.]|nr:hypothetical protein [Methanothrix sp.]
MIDRIDGERPHSAFGGDHCIGGDRTQGIGCLNLCEPAFLAVREIGELERVM